MEYSPILQVDSGVYSKTRESIIALLTVKDLDRIQTLISEIIIAKLNRELQNYSSHICKNISTKEFV
ncbi:hypothetical protein [Acidianus infernus]|uniref:hypothetical protein n=1 Tax=Acidianus infernus TaxID=12915 RepID=UPI0035937983